MIVDLGNGKFQLKSKDGSRVLLKEGSREEVDDAEKRANEHKDEAEHIECGVFRFDRAELKPLRMEPNGWARADGRIGKAGLLTYYRGDKEWVEYRPPDEAFHVDSLASAAGAPLTNGHPPPNPQLGGARLLSAGNTRDFSVGHIVGQPRRDEGDFLGADLLFTDEVAIEDLKAGRKELSSGYLCDVDPTPGTIDGKHYDAIQRNVRYNHVALVKEGRAGSSARVRVDSLEFETVASNHGQGDHTMKIRIDGVAFEVECKDASFEQIYAKDQTARADEIERHVEELAKVRADAAEEVKKAKTASDAEKGRADAAETALKAKTDELQKAPDQIRAEIVRRTKLESVASEFLGESVKLDEMDDVAIMKAVIVKVDPEAKLDDVSGDYLAANFDATLRFAGRSALERGSGPASTRSDGKDSADDEDGEKPDYEKNFAKASAEASKPKPKSKK